MRGALEQKAVDFIENFFNNRPHGDAFNENSPERRASVLKDVAEGAAYEHPLYKDINTMEALFGCLPGFCKFVPDLQQTVTSTGVLSNGHILLRTQVSGTFMGDYGNMKANHKKFSAPVYWEFEFNSDGKIVKAREQGNHHEINEQLGVHFFESPFEIAEREALAKKA